jgi:ABC-type lipoprotein export system ATPase subunit
MSESTAGQPPLLRVEAVERHFDHGAVQALRGISFQADAGSCLALTGPSGCGKSTLLALIGLLDRPDRGRIAVAGQDLATVRDRFAFRAAHVGFVFQHHHMVPTMTLRDNVEAALIAGGVGRRQRRARADELLHAVGLQARADFLPATVSGGERQRAALARALANRPALLLADEPTGSLDSANGQVVAQLLVEHARAQGALVIVATHNPDLAARMDRRLVMLDGRLVDGGGA